MKIKSLFKIKKFKKNLKLSRRIYKLKRQEFTAYFPDEGGLEISLPQLSVLDPFLPKRSKLAHNTIAFSDRPNHEVLLRKIVYEMYENGILDRQKSIIDIGAWIGDNAIIWSKYVDQKNAKVFAIDPSKENTKFGKIVCELNGVKNISWCETVCSESSGQSLSYTGDISHAAFNKESNGKEKALISSTIDSVIGVNYHDRIGLFHIDVEGFEESVILGSTQVISQSKPIILFEQHISTENMEGIFNLLENSKYKIFMINEVLPGCSLDCRNFLAAPSTVDLSDITSRTLIECAKNKIWEAVRGPSLIAI